MAQKEEKSGDEYQFAPPDFDEDQFVHRELTAFKTTSILFGWGIVAAAVSWLAFLGMGGSKLAWGVGLLLCAAFGYSLKFLFPKLGADIAHFKRREWFGTGALFFFTWLSFFILAINPPVTDIAAPQVILQAGPPVQEVGGQVLIDLMATDNDHVASWDAQVLRNGQPYATASAFSDQDVVLARAGDYNHAGHRQAKLDNLPAGSYTVSAQATDGRGHKATAQANFTVGHPIKLVLPAGKTISSALDVIFVQVPGYGPCAAADLRAGTNCVRSVTLDGTGNGGVGLAYSTTTGGWEGRSTLKGWTPGNNTFSVNVEFIDHFLGSQQVSGGKATLAGPFSIDMKDTIGATEVVLVPEPTQRAVLVPGFGLPALALALVGAALVVRRKAE